MAEGSPRPLDEQALLAYAVKLLAGRAHSTGELREKLRRRAEQASAVDGVLTRLKENGYLDDQKFAENFASARLVNDKFGKARVARDLRQRRVAASLVDRTVRKVYQDVNEESLIEQWVRRKYRLTPREGLFQEDKDMAAAYRRLLRAGFRSGEILRVLKRFARNPDLLDAFDFSDEAVDGD
jgi:regulatory protein